MAIKYGFKIISKDTVFDDLLNRGYNWADANQVAYDQLAGLIQQHHDKNLNLIVDLGLAHTPYYEKFLSKMSLELRSIKQFLFVCSDDLIWMSRISERIGDLNAPPNQDFASVDSAYKHYKKYDIYPLTGEKVVDSILSLQMMTMTIE